MLGPDKGPLVSRQSLQKAGPFLLRQKILCRDRVYGGGVATESFLSRTIYQAYERDKSLGVRTTGLGTRTNESTKEGAARATYELCRYRESPNMGFPMSRQCTAEEPNHRAPRGHNDRASRAYGDRAPQVHGDRAPLAHDDRAPRACSDRVPWEHDRADLAHSARDHAQSQQCTMLCVVFVILFTDTVYKHY